MISEFESYCQNFMENRVRLLVIANEYETLASRTLAEGKPSSIPIFHFCWVSSKSEVPRRSYCLASLKVNLEALTPWQKHYFNQPDMIMPPPPVAQSHSLS